MKSAASGTTGAAGFRLLSIPIPIPIPIPSFPWVLPREADEASREPEPLVTGATAGVGGGGGAVKPALDAEEELAEGGVLLLLLSACASIADLPVLVLEAPPPKVSKNNCPNNQDS